MFNKSNNVLIYLSNKGIRVKSKDYDRQVNFDPKIINYLEVTDTNKYKEFVKQQLDLKTFFNKHVYILIEDSILFSKEFVTLVNIVDETLFNDYKDSIPMTLDKINYRTLHLDGSSRIYVINQELYEPIVKTLLNLNCVIEGIYPQEALIEKFKQKKVTLENKNELDICKQIKRYKDYLEDISFKERKVITPRDTRTFTLILGLLLAISITSLITISRQRQEKEEEIIQGLIEVESPVKIHIESTESDLKEIIMETGSEEEAISPVNFEDIKVKILNITELHEEGNKVKDLFINNGNTNIDMGAQEIVNNGYTKVIYKTNDALNQKGKILETLYGYFSNLEESQELTENDITSPEDVVIVVGLAK